MKVKILFNDKKKPEIIHIETRKYYRYILISYFSGHKTSDMKEYKGYENLDQKFKIKRGTKWELSKNLNIRDKFVTSKMEEKSKITKKERRVKMENKANEEYQKRIKELIERAEKGENSPESYRQLLEKLGQVKQSAISIIRKSHRNDKAIIGFVFVLREYYRLSADPKYPFEKGKFQEEIDSLYKLIYEELKKPNKYIPDTWDIDEKKKILRNMRVVLGAENIEQFCKKYNIRKLVRLKLHMRKGYEYYAYCWIITVITLLIIFFILNA